MISEKIKLVVSAAFDLVKLPDLCLEWAGDPLEDNYASLLTTISSAFLGESCFSVN